MICPHCQSHQSRKPNRTTDLGYAAFRCPDCRRTFNERTGTPFNFLEFPTDIVFEIVLCRLLYKHPEVRKWLAARPRYHVHFTPTSSSWLNQVERWFAEI